MPLPPNREPDLSSMIQPERTPDRSVEPWLRSTRSDIPAVARAVLHALDLTREDFERWAWPLTAEQWEARPFGLPSVAFQARHIARSLDRLLTYAEGRQLSPEQYQSLQSEHESAAPQHTQQELTAALQQAQHRILALANLNPDDPRNVGSAQLPVTLGGLLVHLADHSQRHTGQAVTTAKVVLAMQQAEQS